MAPAPIYNVFAANKTMALTVREFQAAMERAENPSMRIPARKGTEKYKRIMEFSDYVIQERRQKQLNEDFLYSMELGNVKEAEKLFWKGADVNAKQDDDHAWGADAWAADSKEATAMLKMMRRLQHVRFLGRDVAVPFYRAFRKCISA
jgi:hypothetical protein